MNRFLFSLFVFWGALVVVSAQNPMVHSHNDYLQEVPFWGALHAGAASVEADVVLQDRELFVAHAKAEIKTGRTLESLYLDPLNKAVALGMVGDRPLQLLIDIKTDAVKTLKQIVHSIKKYPAILERKNIVFVISGNQPEPSEYDQYPGFIFFDYQALKDLSPRQWDRVALISTDYKKYAQWNGKGRFTHTDLQKVKEVIGKAHRFNKPFRFWGTPDSKSAWKIFTDLGVDFINTDEPFSCVTYVNSLKDRVFTNSVFSEVYTPTFESDRKDEKVRNVILLIGDGNGLTQISSSALANNGQLSLTRLKSIGLIKTSSADDFTTDSAAAGTAIAIGEKTNNRAIGVNTANEPVPNICEILSPRGFNTAVITTDQITGATPAAFYAHQKDRDMTAAIAHDLQESNLTLFAGGGKRDFAGITGFSIVDSPAAISHNRSDRVGYFMSERGVPAVLEGRGDLLPEVVDHSLKFLKSRNKPFFAMIEGAQIDSYGHFNNVAGIVTEGIDFDRAIGKALRFADETPGTLVIITADHETSGFSIPQGNIDRHVVEGDFTTNDHTATMVPVFAYGPRSGEFTGVYENNEIFSKILKVLDHNP
ncbi:alkaline phosphatase [Sinomicrobium weinanense]|uniref:Alkaline phosphatase n=1 Tax=Sinomicrobium weinanense TaxID=2842200 RepID=A0A926JPD0_9FLAO|nr:alkaline phosphatase [Sinomicrobium weinanense]MBC9794781.1 alkaline phosphatase [Sinomicrobium weinanense]MBU3125040.1 alkaline phosphatase [Sinomicrobium weinanense]